MANDLSVGTALTQYTIEAHVQFNSKWVFFFLAVEWPLLLFLLFVIVDTVLVAITFPALLDSFGQYLLFHAIPTLPHSSSNKKLLI